MNQPMPRPVIALIHALADGAPHPRAALAHTLAATLGAECLPEALSARTLAEAAALGVRIEAAGETLSLAAPLDLLDVAGIGRLIPAAAQLSLRAIACHPETDSTNERLLALAAEGDLQGLVSLAEYQHAGRGRRGGRWIQPYASGICLSLGWTFPEVPEAPVPLSLVVGVAVARALAGLGLAGVGLKWPNDIHHADAKLGGVLVEGRAAPGGRWQVVLGVGLNHRLPPALPVLDQPITDLARSLSPLPRRQEVAAALLGAMVTALEEWSLAGFAPFAVEWRGLDLLHGREVLVQGEGQGESRGRAAGVAADGALLLAVAGEVGEVPQRIYAGHVRPLETGG
jgi:BirA family biotin operon repressor/biotin-[acetyl-CoA-carboxylase] ligase